MLVANAWVDWFLTIITHVNTNSIAMWIIWQNNAGWDCFKTLILREILKVQNPLLEEHCAFLEVIHLFVPIRRMCKKQTAVSHSSTESEVISLDTGLRLDRLLALDLWDLIVLGNVSRVSDRSGKPESDEHKHHKSHNKIDVMKDIDAVPSNVQSARQEALLCVFEDNEAVIKMIIKGRSPTMRHVSRTHRVALDWLFDRINLDPKIQIKYIDTKNHLADIPIKGNFTRDEWNHLLCLLNISHFQFYSLFWSDDKKISTRFRSGASHCEIATNDESYCKGFLESVIFGVRKTGEEELWKTACCPPKDNPHTTQGPPHFSGGYTESTGIESRCSQSS